MAVWITDEDYDWWMNRAWSNHQTLSVFVNDQLLQMRRVMEQQDAAMNNQRKQGSSLPRSVSGGRNGGSTDGRK